MLKEFRAAISAEALATGNEALLLTIAVGAGSSTVDNGYEVAKIHQHLDWIGVMSYDLHGSWEVRNQQTYGERLRKPPPFKSRDVHVLVRPTDRGGHENNRTTHPTKLIDGVQWH